MMIGMFVVLLPAITAMSPAPAAAQPTSNPAVVAQSHGSTEVPAPLAGFKTALAGPGCTKWCEITEAGIAICHGTGGTGRSCVANGDTCDVEPCQQALNTFGGATAVYLVADDGVGYRVDATISGVKVAGFSGATPKVWMLVSGSHYVATDGCSGMITGRMSLASKPAFEGGPLNIAVE